MASKQQPASAQQAAASHHIDYSLNAVKQFIQQLNSCMHPLEAIKSGVEQQQYEYVWSQLLNADIATVYLTVLIGKLLLTENKIIQFMSSPAASNPPNEEELVNNVSEDSSTLQEVVDQLKLGSAKFDPNHPLLIGRRKSIKTKLRKNIIDLDDSALLAAQAVANASMGNIPPPSPVSVAVTPDKRIFSPYQLLERSAIMNSLIYISLFYRFDYQNGSLLSLIDTWTKLRTQIQAQQGNMQADSLCEEVRESLCPPQEAVFKYIQLCTDFDLMEESDTSLPVPLSKLDPLTMTPAYVYSRLQTVCRIPKYCDQIVDEVIALINLHVSSKQEPIKLRNIFHFLKILIPQMHFDTDDKLKLLTKALQPFFMEPLPVGGLVRDVLVLCKREINYKGSSMRQRLDNTVTRYKTNDGLILEKRRSVNVLFNPCSQFAGYLPDKFDVHADLPEDEVDTAKANLLLNMFEEVEKKPADDLMKAIPLDVLSKFYREATNILKKAELEENKSNLQAAFVKLRQDIIKASKESVSQKYVVTRMKSPKMPELSFNLIALPNEDDLLLCERVKRVYPCSAAYNIIKDLIEKARQEKPDEDKEACVDIAIAGGSGTVQHVAHSIYMIQKLDGKMLEGINIRVYLIPLGENNYLSAWLEKYDGWYSRHLHYPVLSPIPIIPFLKSDNSKAGSSGLKRSSSVIGRKGLQRSKSMIGSPVKAFARKDAVKIGQYKAPKKFLTPHKFMRTLLSDYFTDATSCVPVHIYNVQCLTNEVIEQNNQKQKSRKVVDMLSLSFCQRMEIGFFAEAIAFQRQEKLENATFDEIQANKNFKFSGVQAVLSYVPMDPTGEVNRTAEVNEQSKTYTNISIRSCSMAGDKGEIVAPCQPWLEVYAEEVVVSKDKKKKPTSSTVGINYHVATMSIESSTIDKFTVVLDGEIYGSYHRIVINTASNTMSLMTFSEPYIY